MPYIFLSNYDWIRPIVYFCKNSSFIMSHSQILISSLHIRKHTILIGTSMDSYESCLKIPGLDNFLYRGTSSRTDMLACEKVLIDNF